MEGSGSGRYVRRTADDIFRDFRSRRNAIVKALTDDVQDFYEKCDPEKENLCLYGNANGTWEVSLPVEEVPPEIPEPALGINFARDGMNQRDWLSLVAVHSDSWLLAVAGYFSARFGLNRNDRKRLFDLINDLPTIFEVVSGAIEIPRDRSTVASVDSGSRSKSAPAKVSTAQSDTPSPEYVDQNDEEQNKQSYCGMCDAVYVDNGEFWIGCDVCLKWYHGKCVRISKSKADNIDIYTCPMCQAKKGRWY